MRPRRPADHRIGLLLSGGKVMIAALPCRATPEDRKRIGILVGAGTAIVPRIVFDPFVPSPLASRIVGNALRSGHRDGAQETRRG